MSRRAQDSKELEGLLEALGEAVLDPYVRDKLAADPAAALAAMGIDIPEGVRIEARTDGVGRVRLVVTAAGQGLGELPDHLLDGIVGGAMAVGFTVEIALP